MIHREFRSAPRKPGSRVVGWGAGMLISAALLGATPASAQNQIVLAAADAQATVPTTLSFGIVPQQSASRLAKMWGPLLAHIGNEVGVEIRFQTAKDIPTFEACLAAGAYDLAYMNPIHYAIFSDRSGYLALSRQSKKKLRGILVVRKDGANRTIQDLDGAEIAFPSPGAFGASVLPRAEMRALGVDFSPKYVKSHDSVYRAVAAGLMPAGGGVLRTWNAMDPSIRDQLEIIYQTEKYTPHAIAALPAIPIAVQARIQDVLVSIGTDHPELAQSVGMPGFDPARDADWNDVRGLRLDAADTGISTSEGAKCPSG